jgi:hypothetical protein
LLAQYSVDTVVSGAFFGDALAAFNSFIARKTKSSGEAE